MAWTSDSFITREDLGIAYRKAKADLYYERDHANLIELLEFEENLELNLESLFRRLMDEPLMEWMTSEQFVGRWSVIAKSMKVIKPAGPSTWRASHPDSAWRDSLRSTPRPPEAEFRQVGVHSIDMHVVGALWMQKVGRVYDSALSADAYGSRLRSTDPRIAKKSRRLYGMLTIGSFRQYFEPFRQWRDNGLETIRNALNEQKRVVAMTADARQFYHQVGPDFLLHPAYLRAMGLEEELTVDQRQLTEALIAAIGAWAARTPLHRDNPARGLPVGFPAARLIANVSLAGLDRVIRHKVTPLYYGRYVDDILLVMENGEGLSSQEEVWKALVRKSDGLLEIDTAGEGSLRFVPDYLATSDIRFSGEKQKTFDLRGESGHDLVATIERHIRVRSSEWRSLPDVHDAESGPTTDAITALTKDGEDADSLRKADAVSARRAVFAMRLRDVEAFAQDLPPEAWAEHRRRFFAEVTTHILALPYLLDYATYLPRLLGLAVACADYEAANRILERLDELLTTLQRDCRVLLLGHESEESLVLAWREQLFRALGEACAASVPFRTKFLRGPLEEVWLKLMVLAGGAALSPERWVTSRRLALRLFVHDLGRMPFRFAFLPYAREFVGKHAGLLLRTAPRATDARWIHERTLAGVASFESAAFGPLPKPRYSVAMLFPTRPFQLPELFLVVPSLLGETPPVAISEWTLAFRGTVVPRDSPRRKGGTIEVPYRNEPEVTRIGLTNWHTSPGSWRAAVLQAPDPDFMRYTRMNRLLNDVRACRERPRYLVLPELALPPQWFMRVAGKLAGRGISLIAGVEYLHPGPDQVANQVWSSLVSDFPGYPTFVVHRQDKQRPALHEEAELWSVGGKRLSPEISHTTPPRIKHGKLLFATLICSELTNVEYRAAFRGNVDMLFVPEWNQDTETFSSLVESAAWDVHAFIIQCNHRDFGDTRIRAPFKDAWDRDVVRVKGGMVDYFVIGKLEIDALRRFQSHHRSPSTVAGTSVRFKPVPDGFRIDPERSVLP